MAGLANRRRHHVPRRFGRVRDAIAAVVIGGTSLLGGEGRISGTLIGAFIMGILRNGLNLLGLSSFTQQIIIGSVIILAVLVDMALRKERKLSLGKGIFS